MTQVLLNALVVGTTYALIALGITIIFSIMKVVNFAHGQLYMIGGFVVYYFNVVFGLPFWFGLLMSFLIVGALGVVMELFLFRPVMLRVKREEVTMLLAMGTAVFLESLALIVFGEKQRGVPPIATGIFAVVGIVMKAARVGAFGAMAFTIGKYGVGTLGSLAKLMATFYATALLFVFVVLGAVNTRLLSAYASLVGDGDLDRSLALFFGLLLTVLIVLYDRYRPATRLPAAAGA